MLSTKELAIQVRKEESGVNKKPSKKASKKSSKKASKKAGKKTGKKTGKTTAKKTVKKVKRDALSSLRQSADVIKDATRLIAGCGISTHPSKSSATSSTSQKLARKTPCPKARRR